MSEKHAWETFVTGRECTVIGVAIGTISLFLVTVGTGAQKVAGATPAAKVQEVTGSAYLGAWPWDALDAEAGGPQDGIVSGGGCVGRMGARMSAPASPPMQVTMVTGVVVDERDEPVSGALLWIDEDEGGSLDEPKGSPDVVSDEGGQFEASFRGDGPRFCVIAKRGTELGVRRMVPVEGEARVEVGAVRIARVPAISGIVRDSSGAPLVADVRALYWPSRTIMVERSTRSDKHGAFQLVCQGEMHPLALLIHAAGWAPLVVEDARCGSGRSVYELSVGQWLRGVVVDDEEQPVLGATVALAFPRGFMDAPESFPYHASIQAHTGLGGSFELGGVPDGDVVMEATARGFDVKRVVVSRKAGALGDVRFKLHHIGTFDGVVLDAKSHLPIAGVECGYGEAYSDAEGRFALSAMPETRLVTFKKSGFATRRVRFPPEEAGREMTIELTPACVLEGVAVEQRGQAVVGARIVFELVGPEGKRTLRGASATSDLLGSFRVEAQPGTYGIVRASHPDFPLVTLQGASLGPGEERSWIIVFRAGVDLKVTVRSRRGGSEGSVSDARVRVLAIPPDPTSGDSLPFVTAEGRTGPSGIARIRGLEARVYLVIASAPGFAPSVESVDLREDGDGAGEGGPAETALRLSEASRFEALVVDPNGEPVSGALVIVRVADSATWADAYPRQFLRTDDRGLCHTDDLPDLPLTVEVFPPRDRERDLLSTQREARVGPAMTIPLGSRE